MYFGIGVQAQTYCQGTTATGSPCDETIVIDVALMMHEGYSDAFGSVSTARQQVFNAFGSMRSGLRAEMATFGFDVEFNLVQFTDVEGSPSWESTDYSTFSSNIHENHWNKPEYACIKKDVLFYFGGTIADVVAAAHTGSLCDQPFETSSNLTAFIRGFGSTDDVGRTMAHELMHLITINGHLTLGTPPQCNSFCNDSVQYLMCPSGGYTYDLTTCDVACLSNGKFRGDLCECWEIMHPSFPSNYKCPPDRCFCL